jgi:hypothetical protein
MEQTTDNHYMTREFLENRLVQLTDEVALMTKFREDLISSSNKTHDRLTALQDELQQWTRGELSAEDITVEQAQALAQIGNFTITKSYDVTILVEHSFSVELEAGDDIDDVLGSMDFSANSYHTTLDNEDYSIVETNYDECD